MGLLLEKGADPNLTTNNKSTALMAAAGLDKVEKYPRPSGPEFGPEIEAIKLCLSLGADINAANDQGRTALHGAAQSGANPIIQFLVDHGAKLDSKDKQGRTPLDLAANGRQQTSSRADTVALLRRLANGTPAKDVVRPE
jgi:ankyrin repeat protein